MDPGKSEAPPPYASGMPPTGSRPPAYDSTAGSSTGGEKATSLASTLHTPFPTTITAHGTWSLAGLKTFYLCGESAKDRLFTVETAFGVHKKPLLGIRNGALLHDGKSKDDPIVAACGENVEGSYGVYRSQAANTSSVIVVPDGAGDFATELLAPAVTDGEINFRFGMDLRMGQGTRGEAFEWVKFGKGVEDEYPGGGYRLFKRVEQDVGVAGSSSRPGARATQRVGEALALLAFPKGTLNFKVSNMFSIQFLKVSEVEYGWSEQWKLMVVMTALRLTYLRAAGVTTGSAVPLHVEKD